LGEKIEGRLRGGLITEENERVRRGKGDVIGEGIEDALKQEPLERDERRRGRNSTYGRSGRAGCSSRGEETIITGDRG